MSNKAFYNTIFSNPTFNSFFLILQKEIKKIHEEIKEDYLFAVKKSIVDFVLKEPEIDADERQADNRSFLNFTGTMET